MPMIPMIAVGADAGGDADDGDDDDKGDEGENGDAGDEGDASVFLFNSEGHSHSPPSAGGGTCYNGPIICGFGNGMGDD